LKNNDPTLNGVLQHWTLALKKTGLLTVTFQPILRPLAVGVILAAAATTKDRTGGCHTSETLLTMIQNGRK